MTTDELERRPIPGWADAYEIDCAGDVYTIARTITRSSGWTYPIKARRRRWVVDRRDGSECLKLARNGVYTAIWRHKIMAEVWPDIDAAA